VAANGVARPGGRLAVATRALASAKFLGRKSVSRCLRRRDRTGQDRSSEEAAAGVKLKVDARGAFV
jgi:hypothetical protein